MKRDRNIRLWVPEKLALGTAIVLLDKQSHYLLHVMRCQNGDTIRCFNANNGEFFCQINNIDKKQTSVTPLKQIRQSENLKDIWLLFSPLKKEQTDFVIQKAVELGVTKIIPVITRYTNTDKVKVERLSALATEAAEQCERLSVPEITSPVELDKILANWDKNRILFFMDERRTGCTAAQVFASSTNIPSALLIGPEGGFSEEEAIKLNQHQFVKNICLGPLILRAETAATAALAVWQATAGSWASIGETK